MPQVGEFRLIALAGVPNVGKSTLFNALTGLHQKVGNYPGITVDKHTGSIRSEGGELCRIIDLPGTYNLYPRSEDEQVVFRVLCGQEPDTIPDAVLLVADMSNLERSLFFATQLIDLNYPMAMVLNMEDQAAAEGVQVNKVLLERRLGIPVYTSSAGRGQGIAELKRAIASGGFKHGRSSVQVDSFFPDGLAAQVAKVTGENHPYRALQMLKFRFERTRLKATVRQALNDAAKVHGFDDVAAQKTETALRQGMVNKLMAETVRRVTSGTHSRTNRLDKVFLHKYWGFAIFILILLVMFQSIFTWAQGPMKAIDTLFAKLAFEASNRLPEGALTSLLTEGMIPGIAGIVIFVPQIALLFAFLALLEGSGYMARAVFITDRAMRPFGLNGRSVVPLISGFACAIPAIMATRTIANKRDRLITIFVTPFMSCSARLPVYIILIGLIYPEGEGGLIDGRGLALFGMYVLGILAALVSALALKFTMRRSPGGHLVLELPRYRWPNLKTVLLTMYSKSRTFVVEAGRVILAVSIVLWVLASYGPGDSIAQAEASIPLPENAAEEEMDQYHLAVNSACLEASYAGKIGRIIEPLIQPLGYDWKVGIALITSFAAREVFVSTMATLYSIGADDDDFVTIRERLSQVKQPDGQTAYFNFALVWSLMVFYAFAMQCMSTVAVVYRETKSWKWPLAQTLYMTAAAWLASFMVFQILS